MLYVSTRGAHDAYTAQWALCRESAPDGGVFVPFRLPSLEEKELAAFSDMPFGERVADILRRFFPVQLTGADIDFHIGRAPVKVLQMSRRILVAETWHNLDRTYASAARTVYRLLSGEDGEIPDWAGAAIRIAFLFGIYGEARRLGLLEAEQRVDIAVNAGDFSMPMAAWYAKKMGLPLEMIVCGCSAGGDVWDFLHYGQTPPQPSGGMERLLFEAMGSDGVKRCISRAAGALTEEGLETVRQNLFAAVVGDSRAASIVDSLDRTGAYQIDWASAVAYGGLQDYRASTGESRLTLLWSEMAPEETPHGS